MNEDPNASALPSGKNRNGFRGAYAPDLAWKIKIDGESPEQILNKMRSALIGFLRKKFWYSREEAEDLFHDFVIEVILRRNLLGKYKTKSGGGVRPFILRALRNFATSNQRRARAKKRSPSGGTMPLDRSVIDSVPFSERAWEADDDAGRAQEMLARAIRRLENECRNRGRPGTWAVFEQRLVRPIMEGESPIPYKELVKRFGFKSSAQAQNALTTAKRMFVRCLREVVADSSRNPKVVKQELRDLQQIFD